MSVGIAPSSTSRFASELPRLFSTRVFQLDRSQADTDGRYEAFREKLLRDLPAAGAGQVWLVGDRLVIRNGVETTADIQNKVTNPRDIRGTAPNAVAQPGVRP